MEYALHLLIIHYNNFKALERAVHVYLEFGIEPTRIYVFDNGSTSSCMAELEQLRVRHRLSILYAQENLGWGAAINQFLASRTWSEGDLLGISAHDAVLRKADWCVLDQEFADRAVLFVSPQYPVPLRCVFSLAKSFRCKRANASKREEVVVGNATLCFVRPAVIVHFPYDEAFFIYGCESEIFLRANDAGYKTISTTGIIVENPSTDASSEFRTLAFAINSVYVARLRHGRPGYWIRLVVVAMSVARLYLLGRQVEAASKYKALGFSWRTCGAGFKEFLQCKV